MRSVRHLSWQRSLCTQLNRSEPFIQDRVVEVRGQLRFIGLVLKVRRGSKSTPHPPRKGHPLELGGEQGVGF